MLAGDIQLPEASASCAIGSPSPPEIAVSLNRSKRSLLRTPLGEYEVIRTLGQGSYGKVKLVRNSLTQEKMAVKIIRRYPHHKHKRDHPDHKRARTLDQRVLREANLCRILGDRHPNILRLKIFRVTDGHFFLFYEYVDGVTLSDRIGRTGLPEAKAREYFREIVEAIGYCHAYSIIHRDLKLENIMIDNHSKGVKLIDFGLANFYDRNSMLKTACGSIPYTAPEILRGDRYMGPEVDIWSLGVLLYVLITGMLPFGDPSVAKNFENIMAGNFWIPYSMSDELQNLLIRMLEPNVGQRIQLSEIAAHPWMNDAFDQHRFGISDEVMVGRETIVLPLAIDPRVVTEVALCLFRDEALVQRQLEEALNQGTLFTNGSHIGAHGLGLGYTVKNHASSHVLVQVRNSPVVSLYFLISEQMDRNQWLLSPLVDRLATSSVIEAPQDSIMALGHVESMSTSMSLMQGMSLGSESVLQVVSRSAMPPVPVDQSYPNDLKPDSGSALQRFSSTILQSLNFKRAQKPSLPLRSQTLEPEPSTRDPATTQVRDTTGKNLLGLTWNRSTAGSYHQSPLKRWSTSQLTQPLPATTANLVLAAPAMAKPVSTSVSAAQRSSLEPRTIGLWSHITTRITFPRQFNALSSQQVLDRVLDICNQHHIVHRYVTTRQVTGLTDPAFQALPKPPGKLRAAWERCQRRVMAKLPFARGSQATQGTKKGRTQAKPTTKSRRPKVPARHPYRQKQDKTKPPSLDGGTLLQQAAGKRFLFFGSVVVNERKLRRLQAQQSQAKLKCPSVYADPVHRAPSIEPLANADSNAAVADGNSALPTGLLSERTTLLTPAANNSTTVVRKSRWLRTIPKIRWWSWWRRRSWMRSQSLRPSTNRPITVRQIMPVPTPSLKLICQYTPSLGPTEHEVTERYSCGIFAELVKIKGLQQWALLVHQISGHRVKYQRLHQVLRRMVVQWTGPPKLEASLPTRASSLATRQSLRTTLPDLASPVAPVLADGINGVGTGTGKSGSGLSQLVSGFPLDEKVPWSPGSSTPATTSKAATLTTPTLRRALPTNSHRAWPRPTSQVIRPHLHSQTVRLATPLPLKLTVGSESLKLGLERDYKAICLRSTKRPHDAMASDQGYQAPSSSTMASYMTLPARSKRHTREDVLRLGLTARSVVPAE
ncbi:Serine/threonine-protein kinase [Dimargaris verticillata]|uniref:Serine/threonine-protein kinase n=1 Tax=Dimargaris verticillata TaxID=2761393 RepID=A0A9W8E8Q7_9FUNG|nr:Serine/threonine-protein kinase [Dimargaris verticillata]